ncbi:MAG: radical SAM protein [Polyangiaceae bacterium]|nr:radical SAM protein [Polyangiaceae bacterium]MCE7888759.1 radical SAM protein [Sorangiineae bacterium PRO1]MCL4753501.1 radical SAM protein [Myxococcales bacterium]
MATRFLFDQVVLQPTSLCNLNCSYCYVPHRDEDRRMSPRVTERLAESLWALPKHQNPIYLLWHSGEPLAVGLAHMRALCEPFLGLEAERQIAHRLQTNATLIDAAWCEFFDERRWEIAISLDGPRDLNRHRLDWAGRPSFEKVLRGIERLREVKCDLVVLLVVTEETLGQARDLYEFFAGLGCIRLGVNIEERSGINLGRPMLEDPRVAAFWSDLYEAFAKNPVIEIREFRLFAAWWDAVLGVPPPADEQPTYRTNLLPTIGYDGEVVFLSTEILQTDAGRYGRFEVGNILTESLDDLVKRAKRTPYVRDFLEGVDACKAQCSYYSFCGGGFPANKFSELGTMNATETVGCLNTRRRLYDVLMEKMRGQDRSAAETLLPKRT